MTPAELESLAEAVARKLAPRLVTPIRLNRKAMAAAIGVSTRTLQAWSNRESDPCPSTKIDSIVLYNLPEVSAWLYQQSKTHNSRNPQLNSNPRLSAAERSV